MHDHNLNAYNLPQITNWYQRSEDLMEAETFFFEANKNFILDASILDIGIGAGRTSAYLHGRCKNYTGIDYASAFIGPLKKKIPGIDIRLMDARNLSAFSDGSFDLVVFSFNGIDYVGLADRKRILSEVNRVLKPGGIFFFSTHNKNNSAFNRAPWLNKNNSFITNFKTLVKLSFFLPRHFKNKKAESYFADYAIINNSAHNYSLFTFYSTPAFLKQLLLGHNFTGISLLSKQGIVVGEKDLDEWIFVSCKKLPL